MDPFSAELNAFAGGLDGKRILDVGSGFKGKLILDLEQNYNIAEAIGLEQNTEPKRFSAKCSLESGDIRGTHYEDNSFDLIVSRSAFEHIHDLPQALREMHRILKPGGVLYSKFGPIWSCVYGHHLWFGHHGETITYWNTILPPYAHLLMHPQELIEWCMPKWGEELTAKIINWIYVDPAINRLHYEDYEQAVADSPFRTLFFSGYQNPRADEIYNPLLQPDVFDRLQDRFPRYSNFLAVGIRYLGRKV